MQIEGGIKGELETIVPLFQTIIFFNYMKKWLKCLLLNDFQSLSHSFCIKVVNKEKSGIRTIVESMCSFD